MVAGFEVDDTDKLTGKGLADENDAALPLDLACVAHAPDLMIGIIPGIPEAIRHGFRRRCVKLRRGPLTQGFVRALLVVVPAEGVEAGLLFVGIARRRTRGLRLQGAMHPLMAAIVLRRSRADEAQPNAKPQPPRRQSCQPAGSGTAEWRSIVAADRSRQSIASEGPLKHWTSSLDRLRRDLDFDQKTAVTVRHGQGIDPLLVQRAEPPFEVHAPFVVGGLDFRKWLFSRVDRLSPPLDRLDQVGPLEDVADRRGRRPARPRPLVLELSQQLARTQIRKLLSHLHDLVHRPRSSPMRATQCGMRAVHKPALLAAGAPLTPFIKGVAANSVAATQFRHAPIPRLIIRQHQDPLFHATSFPKRHRSSSLRCNVTCRQSARSKLSGIYPDYTLTRPLTPALSPQAGRKRGEGVRRAL